MGAYESTIGVNINEYLNPNGICRIFPNPGYGIITFGFNMNSSGVVILNIYDLKGTLLQTLKEFQMSSSDCQLKVNTSGFKKGVYYYQLITPDHTMNGKISVIK